MLHDDYILSINQKYNGKLTIDPLKKTYTYSGVLQSGKLQSQVSINGVTVLFTYNFADETMPYSTSIVLKGEFPRTLQFIPRNKYIWSILGAKRTLSSRYKIIADNNLNLAINSNQTLCDLIMNHPVSVAISRRDSYRVVSIVPQFSILTPNDYSELEQITLQFIDCIIRPQLHEN